MRPGFMTSTCPRWSVAEILAAATRLGFAGVEPRIGWGHRHGIEPGAPPDRLREVRSAFADAGVAISCVATGIRLAVPPGPGRQQQLDELRRCVDLAVAVGAPYLRLFGGGERELALDQRVGYATETLAAGVAALGDAPVTLLLETHDYFSRGRDVGRVLDAISDPRAGALWDTGHPVRAGEAPVETASHLRLPRVRHVHTYDLVPAEAGRLQTTPDYGQGNLPLRDCLRLLRQSGYSGFLSFEYIFSPDDAGHDPEALLTKLAAGLRRLLDSL